MKYSKKRIQMTLELIQIALRFMNQYENMFKKLWRCQKKFILYVSLWQVKMGESYLENCFKKDFTMFANIEVNKVQILKVITSHSFHCLF